MAYKVCSFICQVASARKQWRDVCGLWIKLPSVTTCLTN